MSEQKELKPLPVLRRDEDAERFVDEADLTDYDLSGFRRVHFAGPSPGCKRLAGPVDGDEVLTSH